MKIEFRSFGQIFEERKFRCFFLVNVAGHHDDVVLVLVASSVEDDDGLTRPGAKRVRLWRDRSPRGGVPPFFKRKSGKSPLCREALALDQNYKIQGGQQSPLFMAMGKSFSSRLLTPPLTFQDFLESILRTCKVMSC